MIPDESVPSVRRLETTDTLPTQTTTREFSLLTDEGIPFDSLDQMGPAIQSICQSGKEEAFLNQVDAFVERKQAEIEQLCNTHYQVNKKDR
jgi:DNA-binding transcriptional regulator YhcF (GntR family)